MARILVVEFDADIRELLHDLLTGEGHDVDQAADGEEGIQAYRRNPPELVILRDKMPGKSGAEMRQGLVPDHPDPNGTSTTVHPVDSLPDLSSLGVEHILKFPCTPEELTGPVRELVGS